MKKNRTRFILFAMLVFSLILTACSSTATATPTTAPATQTATSSTGNAYPAAGTTPSAVAYPAESTSTAAATSAATSAKGAISLTDGLGRQVTLQSPAQRIVSLAPSNTELLFSVGAGSKVVGRDQFSDYPTDVSSIASIGGSSSKYDLEAIAALKPDLVLAAEINTADQVKSLENLGLTVYYLSNPKDLNGLYQNIQIIGTLTGNTTEANALNQSLQTRVKAVQDKLANITTHPKVYYELDSTDPTKPWTAGTGSFIDTLISMAGGTNIASSLNSSYVQISAEDIISQNPDFILLGDAAYGTTVASVGQRTGWTVINALKNNQVYTFDDNTASRPTARLVDALETLAKLIHPEAFK